MEERATGTLAQLQARADGKTSTAGFLAGLAGAIPPIHELARNAGVELPTYLGTAAELRTRETPPTDAEV